MSTKNERLSSCIYGMLGAGLFTLIYHSGPAVGQTVMGFMVVQPTTPGLTQTGHSNISADRPLEHLGDDEGGPVRGRGFRFDGTEC